MHLHTKMRTKLIKKHAANHTDVPNCFGTLPQGNESAWAKGCKECPLYTDSDACSKATNDVDEAYRALRTKRAFKTEIPCKKCQGLGKEEHLIWPENHKLRWQKCYNCYGTGFELKQCPKCKEKSGCDWTRCEGDCPMQESPDYRQYILKTDERGPYVFDRKENTLVPTIRVVELLNEKGKSSD